MNLSTSSRQAHWQNVYQTRADTAVSWFEAHPAISLELIRATGVDAGAPIIDVGGGASRLVDALIEAGFTSLAVLDVAATALAASRSRLGPRGAGVEWIAGDVTNWRPARTYDVWHDRAAFHFLTEPNERAAYVACVREAVRPGGHVNIGTFAPDGPERCSGLPVMATMPARSPPRWASPSRWSKRGRTIMRHRAAPSSAFSSAGFGAASPARTHDGATVRRGAGGSHCAAPRINAAGYPPV